MRVKYGKFYARWLDENRRQRMKAFGTRIEAVRFQDKTRAEMRIRREKGASAVKNLAAAWFEAHSRFQDHRDRFFSRRCVNEMTRVAGDQQVCELSYMVPNSLIDEWKTNPHGKSKPYATATLFNLRFRLKNLLTWLVQHGGSPELTNKLQRTPTPQPRQSIAEAWEIESIKAASPPWFKCFVLFCLDGGLRTAEALRICPANYSAGTSQFIIEVKKRRVKNFHASEELKSLLEIAPKTSDSSTPFVTLFRGQTTSDEHIYPYFKKLLVQIGSQPRMVNGKLTWLHPHDLRRTIATWMYWKTKNIRQVQEYLGHAHAVTTLRYIVHANAAEILPIIEELKVERRQEAAIQIQMRSGKPSTTDRTAHFTGSNPFAGFSNSSWPALANPDSKG